MRISARKLKQRFCQDHRRLITVAWIVCAFWVYAIALVAGKTSVIVTLADQMRWSESFDQHSAFPPPVTAMRRCRQKNVDFVLIKASVEVVLKSPLFASTHPLSEG